MIGINKKVMMGIIGMIPFYSLEQEWYHPTNQVKKF